MEAYKKNPQNTSTVKIYDHGIQSYHFVANKWGEKWKQWKTILLGSKITADGDCSQSQIKRHLLLEEKLWPT